MLKKNKKKKRKKKKRKQGIFLMGFLVFSGEESGQSSRVGFKALIRRKQVDSAHSSSSSSSSGHHQLARELSIPHLISIGIHVVVRGCFSFFSIRFDFRSHIL